MQLWIPSVNKRSKSYEILLFSHIYSVIIFWQRERLLQILKENIHFFGFKFSGQQWIDFCWLIFDFFNYLQAIWIMSFCWHKQWPNITSFAYSQEENSIAVSTVVKCLECLTIENKQKMLNFATGRDTYHWDQKYRIYSEECKHE